MNEKVANLFWQCITIVFHLDKLRFQDKTWLEENDEPSFVMAIDISTRRQENRNERTHRCHRLGRILLDISRPGAGSRVEHVASRNDKSGSVGDLGKL